MLVVWGAYDASLQLLHDKSLLARTWTATRAGLILNISIIYERSSICNERVH